MEKLLFIIALVAVLFGGACLAVSIIAGNLLVALILSVTTGICTVGLCRMFFDAVSERDAAQAAKE